MHRMALHGVLTTHPGAARHGDRCQDRTANESHNFVFHLFSPLEYSFDFVCRLFKKISEARAHPSTIFGAIGVEIFFSNTLTDLDLSAHLLVAITIVGVDSGLRKREAEALAFAVQRRIKSAALPFPRDCGNRVKNLIFIKPRDRRACLYLYSPRLVLKEFNCDIGGWGRFIA